MAEEKLKLIPTIIIIVVTLLSGTVYVVEFGDIIDYNDTDNKIVTFKDKLGLPIIGKEIGRAKILSHGNLSEPNFVGNGNQQVIQIHLENKGNSKKDVIGPVEFINIKTGELDELKYYWEKAIFGDVEIQDQEMICVNDYVDSTGLVDGEVCYMQNNGSYIENQIIKWERLFTNDLPEGNFTLGLVVFVSTDTSHDAIINIFGKKVKKWATWSNDLTNGIMGYWKYDEGTGTVMEEYFNGTNNMTGSDGNGWVVGKINNAWTGQTQQIDSTFDFSGKTEFTINFWINNTGWTGTPWGGSSVATEGNMYADGEVDHMKYQLHDGTGWKIVNGMSSTPRNTYWMTTITVTQTTLTAYYNGVYNNSIATDGAVTFNTVNILFFGRQGGVGYEVNNVDFDEISFHERVLSQPEITQLFNSGTGIQPPAPPPDPCIYTSGNWEVDCADNCEVSSNVAGDGSNLIIDGTGKFTMDANVSGFSKYIIKGDCKTYCQTGCFLA